MYPTRSDWNSWTALEKVGYIAQILATFSLLPTVLFAWLSWQEVRLARTEQLKLFFAEKAPNIDVSNISILKGILTITLENAGQTPANSVSILIKQVGKNETLVDTNNEDSMFFNRIHIRPSEKFEFPLLKAEDLSIITTWIPSSAKEHEPGMDIQDDESWSVLFLIRYRDIRSEEYFEMGTIVLKK